MRAIALIGLAIIVLGIVASSVLAEGKTQVISISQLIEQLKNDDSGIRNQAKAQLVKRGEEAGKAALAALSAAPPEMAYDLVMVIYHTDYRQAIEGIKAKRKKTDNPRIRLVTSMALCRFDVDYTGNQDYILRQTKSNDQAEALMAMQMLGYIGDTRVVGALKDIFYDQERPDQIRQAAIWDLSHTPVPASAEVLVGIVDDPKVDWFYKEIVIAGLRGLAAEPGMAEVVNRLLEKVQGIPSGGGRSE